MQNLPVAFLHLVFSCARRVLQLTVLPPAQDRARTLANFCLQSNSPRHHYAPDSNDDFGEFSIPIIHRSRAASASRIASGHHFQVFNTALSRLRSTVTSVYCAPRESPASMHRFTRLTSYGKCSSGSKLRVWMGVLEILCRVLVSSDDCEPRLATFLKRPQGCGLLQIGGCLLLLPSKAASRALRPSSCPPSDSLPTTPPQ